MYWVFKNIEMPIVEVVCDMEDTGVEFDFAKNAEFKVKYHNLLDEREEIFIKACEPYAKDITEYNLKQPKPIFDTPVNIKSAKQLTALIYDIMKLEPQIDKKTKKPIRSTDKDAMAYLVQKYGENPIIKAISSYRELSTIVSTFIDKLPECVHTDGRIHS